MNTLEQLRSGELAGATRLDLACGLTHFPPEIFELADTLEVLNLSGNALRDLPPDLGRLHKLRVLFASNNAFTHLPASIGQCAQLSMVGFKANQIEHVPAASLPAPLRWLILTDNAISVLPSALGERPALQKLMLAGNQLTQLPGSLAQCAQLELLRLAANRLEALPDWLLRLPRLSWLAYAGNPLTANAEAQALQGAQAAPIDWATLAVHAPLGEGASGVIHAGQWHTAAGTLPVAVKLFKGSMTSDGLPRSEMAATLAAGSHPNLVGVHGGLSQHPEQREGLVMPRMAPGYGPLAGPPSLASCTRDVYPAGLRLTLPAALQLAHGLACAAAHLHARGILHGDLYAHNTLWMPDAQAGQAVHGVLSDFGAASFLPLADQAMAHALTQLEVRAMGCLLAELLALVGGHLPNDADRADGTEPPHLMAQAQAPTQAQAQAPAITAALRTLQQQCLQPDTPARPAMAEIASRLQALSAQLAQASA